MNTPDTTTKKPEGLDNLASQAQNELRDPPLGEGTTDLDVAARDGQAAPPVSNAEIIKGALIAGRDVFCAFTQLQSPKVTMPDEGVAQLANLWGTVCDKRGINLGAYLGDYAAEIAAALATMAMAAGVRAGVMAELAARKAAAKSAEGATDTPAPDEPTDGVTG